MAEKMYFETIILHYMTGGKNQVRLMGRNKYKIDITWSFDESRNFIEILIRN